MKLTSDEFNELQRWMEVRDYCQEAKTCLRLATEFANGHHYNADEYKKAFCFINHLEYEAIKNIEKMIEVQE